MIRNLLPFKLLDPSADVVLVVIFCSILFVWFLWYKKRFLRTSEFELQSTIVNNMAEGVCLVRAQDGIIAYANPKFAEMFGYEVGALEGQNVVILNADDIHNDAQETASHIMRSIKELGSYTYEVHNKKKDGSFFWCRATTSILVHPSYGTVFVAVQKDITERKKNEEALKLSEKRYRTLFEGAYDSILVADNDGKIVMLNEQLAKKFGYSSEEVLGKPIELLIPERYHDKHVISRKKYSQDPHSRPMGASLELYGRKKDGSEFPVDISLSPTQFEEGLRITAIIRDVTDRKRFEDQQSFLSQMAKSLNEVLEYEERAQIVADGLIQKLADTCVLRIFVDDELRPIGVATRNSKMKEELLAAMNKGVGLAGPYGALEVAATRKTVLVEDAKAFIRNNDKVEEDLRSIADKMGITSYVSIPLIVQDNVIGTLTISMSISGRRFSKEDVIFIEIVANRAAVAIENARLFREAQIAKLVANNLPALIAYWDKDQRCRFANQVYLEWFGFKPEMLIGKTMKEVLGPVLYEKNLPFITGALKGQAQNFERDLIFHTTGELRHTQTLYLPEKVSGKVLGFFVLVNDVTELKRAVKLRENVLGIVSHDLKNPLATIDMSAQLLTRGEPTQDKVQQHAERILSSSKTMQRLINDLLDFGKIQGGTLSVERAPTEVTTILEEAMQSMNVKALEKNVRIRINISPDCPKIFADQHRIVQVIWNLVGNAIKFSSAGAEVIIEAKLVADFVQFTVIDNGPGIASEDLPKVFNRFWQATQTAAMGSGLGLAIAKGIVEAHQGKIWAESTLGQGCRFHFTIPTKSFE